MGGPCCRPGGPDCRPGGPGSRLLAGARGGGGPMFVILRYIYTVRDGVFQREPPWTGDQGSLLCWVHAMLLSRHGVCARGGALGIFQSNVGTLQQGMIYCCRSKSIAGGWGEKASSQDPPVGLSAAASCASELGDGGEPGQLRRCRLGGRQRQAGCRHQRGLSRQHR
jgi:hypothetical protein